MPAAAEGRISYVFGYGSLAELTEPLVVGEQLYPAVPGRLHGFRRRWGVAMSNWEASADEKHFVDPESGLKPTLAVAYLDIEEAADEAVNGLANPGRRGAAARARRARDQLRADRGVGCVRAVVGARGLRLPRDRSGATAQSRGRRWGRIFASRQYVERIERAFAALGPGQLDEYQRTTEPLPFPVRELEPRYPTATASSDGGDLLSG
jgi:hypothetical protein